MVPTVRTAIFCWCVAVAVLVLYIQLALWYHDAQKIITAMLCVASLAGFLKPGFSSRVARLLLPNSNY